MCLTKCQFDNMTKLSSIISQLQRQEKFIMKNQTVKRKMVVNETVAYTTTLNMNIPKK